MLYKDEGFVIKKNDMLNEDKVVQLFLRENGKISSIAKGVKKITSRKAGNLELLSLCLFSLAKGKTLDIITEVKSINSFPLIHEDQMGSFFLFYIDEIIHRMVYDGETNEDIYDLLKEILLFFELHRSFRIGKLIDYFNIKILHYSGIYPDFYTCIRCARPIEENDEKIYEKSGIAHALCMSGQPVSTQLIKVFRFVKDHSIEEFDNIKVDLTLEKQIFLLTIDMIEYTIGEIIKSKVYIHE